MVVAILLPAMLLFVNSVQSAAASTEWKKTSGKLTAILVLTDKPKVYAKAWSKQKSKLPTGLITTAVKKSKLLVAMVFFKGCGGDATNLCDSEITYHVFKPNGKLYAKRVGLSLWKNRVIKSGLMLSSANLALSFDAKDPLGKYKVIVNISDNISKKKLKLIRFVTVSK